MYALAYRSILNIGYGAEDLESIRKVSEAYNSENNITGCLFFHNNSFVEIIEGKKRSVLRLFAKTRIDNRYQDLFFLNSETHSRRYFETWNMGFYEAFTGRTDRLEEGQFLRDMLLFHDLSEKSTSTLRCFWSDLRSMLNDGFRDSDDILVL